MKFIVREGKRRGRGHYLTRSSIGLFNGGFHHYTKRQRKAHRFDTVEEALAAAEGCVHIPSYRVVKLVRRPILGT